MEPIGSDGGTTTEYEIARRKNCTTFDLALGEGLAAPFLDMKLWWGEYGNHAPVIFVLWTKRSIFTLADNDGSLRIVRIARNPENIPADGVLG